MLTYSISYYKIKINLLVVINYIFIVPIELPKARRKYREEPDNAICQWMMFMDNPNESEVIQIMEENKNIKKAIEELEQVSGNEKLRRIAELKEKYIRDEQASIEYAQNVEKRNIARAMLKENVNIELILKVTGLSKEEIEKMKEEN